MNKVYLRKKEVLSNIFLICLFLISFFPKLSIISTPIIIVFAILYVRQMIIHDHYLMATTGYLLFIYFILIIGNFALEFYSATKYKSGAIMYNGTTVRLIVYMIFLYKGFSFKIKRNRFTQAEFYTISRNKMKYIRILTILAVLGFQLITFNVVRKNGIALGDRLGYQRMYMNNLEVYAKFGLAKASFFLGYIYSYKKDNKIIILNFISIILLKMIGIKFGEIFLNLTYFIMPITIRYIGIEETYIPMKKIRKGILFFLVIILIAIGNLSMVYSKAYGTNLTNGFSRTLERISAQSLLYHFIDSDMDIFDNNMMEIENEIKVIALPRLNLLEYIEKGNEPIGLFKLNKEYDIDSYESNLKYGYSLSGGFPGIILYYFGFLPTICIMYYIGKALALVYSDIVFFMKRGSLVGLILVYKIFDYIYSILILGNIYYFFRPSFIIVAVTIAIYKFVLKDIKEIVKL